jgi:inositol oxygenase
MADVTVKSVCPTPEQKTVDVELKKCPTPDERVQKEVWLKRVVWLDASDIFRPEKRKEAFRIFDPTQSDCDPIMKRIFKLYTEMHTNQTMEYNKKMREKWLKFDMAELTIMEALELLTRFIDESDPDIDLPNNIHAYQTAERLREQFPDEDWLHLTGLIHDIGKVMGIWGAPQFATAGDTFVIGCRPADSIVLRDCTFQNYADLKDERYNTECGIYEPHCGFDNVTMSWGHDEYFYQVVKNHPENHLPDVAMYILRFHSFYPFFEGGEYQHIANERDNKMLHWLRVFNKYDLYSKADVIPDMEKLKPYYQGLINKYLPGKLRF